MQNVDVQIPAPPPPPDIPAPGVSFQGAPNARAILLAKEQQREVLGDQMSRLLRRREDVSEQLQDATISGAQRTALEQHYTTLNGRIIDMERQMQTADAEWSAAAGVPGAAVEPRVSIRESGPPEEMLILGTIFTGIAGVILAAAFARRLIKGGGKVIAQIPAAFEARFTRLEQSLDAVAIEIERVSEGQRFLTRVFADQNPRAVGAGPAQQVEVGAAERERVR
ncbi:MAG TPA: hypothetical protein VFT96_12320 [Gemmatimonadaceae bacterium]|nr:hypothetical protein [Gemmatimonadaceae bacterium]